MWDHTIEHIVDQRSRLVPPLLVRNTAPNSAARPIAKSSWRVAATGPDRCVLTEALSIIQAAQQVVVFSSFLLSDIEIQRALLEAAARGCRVYGLVAAEAKLDRDVSDEDDFETRTAESHKQMLNEFAGSMLIRSSPAFHAKCVLADPATAVARGILLTANLTTEALTRNEELAVRLSVPETQEMFEQLRYAIWEMAERELVGKGQLDRVKPLGRGRVAPVRPARRRHDGCALSDTGSDVGDDPRCTSRDHRLKLRLGCGSSGCRRTLQEGR
ncbi:MAG: phospholipase D family protein [Phycisphaerales bacterium]|nr:phospholipase D family protein [Phycisphaerales bacterium]